MLLRDSLMSNEVNEGLQQYLNERNNDEERASSHVRKDVIDYTNQRLVFFIKVSA